MFTSSLFTEKAQQNHLFWRQLGYLYDFLLCLSAKNATLERGHSTINNHAQLKLLLNGLHKVQTGEDTCLNNVLVTINGIRCQVKVVVPILYFMNDAKEGNMLCCRVASHNKVNCHC